MKSASIMGATPAGRRRTGRPLSFDRDAALRAAMLLFWRHGYETTSVADLVAAMGVTPPSLYGAFGDKRRLFLDAMRLYAGDPEDTERAIAEAPSAREAARRLLHASAVKFTGEDTPPGCLLASATASGSAASADVQAAVAAVRRGTEAALRDRIERDVAESALPEETHAVALAAMTMAVMQGLSTLARDGAGRGKLLAVAEAALAAWPPTPPAPPRAGGGAPRSPRAP
jgi:AcrR family transcriptional regulator